MTSYEGLFRVGAFLLLLISMGAWEIVAPRRTLSCNKSARWFSNIGLLVINTIAMRIVLATGAVGIATAAEAQQWGLFNVLGLLSWVEVLLSVFILDFVIYLQHILFHRLPLLWRLHRVHHADPDFDVTTGVRFHTLEILLSMGIKAIAIVLLGASPVAVLIFEIVLNATSMFSHSNVKMPAWLDAALRLIVVTPDMHRVHHSVIRPETNSNFGFNLPWWDYLLGTYRSQPKEGHESMRIGLTQIPPQRAVWIHWLLVIPFAFPLPSSEDAGKDP